MNEERRVRDPDTPDDFEHLHQESAPIEADLLGLHDTAGGSAAHPVTDKPTEKIDSAKMDSNLLQMGDSFPDRREADAKLDKFLDEFRTSEKADPLDKEATKNLLDMERVQPTNVDLLDRYSDSEPEQEDFKQSQDFERKFSPSPTSFSDVREPELPKELPKPVETPRVQEVAKKEPEKPSEPKKQEPVVKKAEAIIKKAEPALLEAEAMFCKMGLGE